MEALDRLAEIALRGYDNINRAQLKSQIIDVLAGLEEGLNDSASREIYKLAYTIKTAGHL